MADWTLNNGYDVKKLLIKSRKSGRIYTKVDNEILKGGFKKILK